MSKQGPEYKVRIGGVLRCCLDRSYADGEWPEHPDEGDTLDCKHGCGSQLVFHGGAFEWFRPDHPLRGEGEKTDG